MGKKQSDWKIKISLNEARTRPLSFVTGPKSGFCVGLCKVVSIILLMFY